MKKTTRVILFAIVAVMLFSLAPFCAFADTITADAVITAGGSATVTVSPYKQEYILEFTAPEDGDYVIWSEGGYFDDLMVKMYDAVGDYVDEDDDTGFEAYYNNFNLEFEALEGEKYYFVVSSCYGERNTTAPVFVDKSVAATGIELLNEPHPATTVVGEYYYIHYRLLPANAASEMINIESDDTSVAEVSSFSELEFVDVGDATITLSLESDPEIKTSFVVNVTEPYFPAITLDELVPLTSTYKFTAPEDGDYVFYTTQPVDLYIDGSEYNSKAVITMEQGQSVVVMNDMSTLGIGSLGVKKATATKDFVLSLYMYDAFDADYKKTDTVYPGQSIMILAELSDPASLHSLDVTFDVDLESGVVVDAEDQVLEVIFEAPGSYVVTAQDDGGKSVTRTIVVSDYPEVTLDKPYVYSTDRNLLNGFSSVQFPVAFTAPEDGEYYVEVSNDMGLLNSVAVLGSSGNMGINSIGGPLDKGERLVFVATTNIMNEVDLLKKGELNVTVTVKKWEQFTDLLVPETLTMHVRQVKTVELTPVPETGWINLDAADITTVGDIDAQILNGKLLVIAYNEGEASVTLDFLDNETTKTINIEVLPARELELDTAADIDDGVLNERLFFTAPEDGFYTFSISNAVALCQFGDAIGDGLAGILGFSIPRFISQYLDEGEEIYIDVSPFGDASLTVTKAKQATDMYIAGTMTLYMGGKLDFTYVDPASPIRFTPFDAVPQQMADITIADPSVAIVNDGQIIATGVGSTTVEFETEYGLKATAKLVVIDRPPAIPMDIYLNKTELTLEEGASETLIATAELVDDAVFYWSSTDEAVATVDENGRVTAVGVGTATIYANYFNVPLECAVTVTEKVLPPSSEEPDPPAPPVIKDTTKIFKDVEAGKWYVDAINYAYSYGFIAGVATDKFGVDEDVTRGQFITILARIAGVDTSKNDVTTKFTDVDSGRYYTAAIKWASENGIVAGVSDTEFAPGKAIERQQLCVMIVNFAKNQGIELTAAEAAITFADADTIANYAKTAVATCQRADIINGYNEGGKLIVKPTATATRAEAAQILYKFHKDFVAK